MLSWWKKTKNEEPEKLTIRDIRESFEFLINSQQGYDTVLFINSMRSVIDITGDFGSSWKFALTDVMENVNKLENLFNEKIPSDSTQEHPYSTLTKLIESEKLSNEKCKGPGTRLVLELLHVLNYAQCLFEELAFNQSQFIYNEYFPNEVNIEPVSAPNAEEEKDLLETLPEEDVAQIIETEKQETEQEQKKKKKTMRQCAYDAYLSALAPKHSKTIQYAVWTASFSLPSRKTAYSKVYKLSKEAANKEFEILLPLIRQTRKDLYQFILQDNNIT